MIEMISDLLKETKEDIISLIEWIKTFGIVGKTIIEIKNAPGMKIINNLKDIITIIAIAMAGLVIYIRNKVRKH